MDGAAGGCCGRRAVSGLYCSEASYERRLLRKPANHARRIEVNLLSGGGAGQAGHGHDVAADGDDEPGTGGEAHFADSKIVAERSALLRGIGGKAVLGLGDAHRQMAEAELFPVRQLGADFGRGDDRRGRAGNRL